MDVPLAMMCYISNFILIIRYVFFSQTTIFSNDLLNAYSNSCSLKLLICCTQPMHADNCILTADIN